MLPAIWLLFSSNADTWQSCSQQTSLGSKFERPINADHISNGLAAVAGWTNH
jgi:hypothetical protein